MNHADELRMIASGSATSRDYIRAACSSAADEIVRLRAALASIPEKIGHMRETHAVLHKAEHAQSWGDGYTTAQQIALNIANGVIEQDSDGEAAMNKEFQTEIERVERAEELAPPGSHEHDMYVKAALMAAWPTFKVYAELLRRSTGQVTQGSKE